VAGARWEGTPGRSSFWQAVAACATPGPGEEPRPGATRGQGREEGLPLDELLRDAQLPGLLSQLL
jgi:hypothetical protein